MKITVTEIEATADELRQSNTLSDGLTRVLRSAFNNIGLSRPVYNFSEENAEDEEETDNE